ncbi:uncharacterized protein SAPINGB_P003118 [Magnusiomyces paraingens]|uniref:F-box domain-containing protein n=1 Tax=Magnusiomyces paraingens TaxID=2606893 RepID=A0A5E8BIL8_9ASCO|nr:uncharacterized protein SAPINGB_P003118 [Saprochaete ingens]VVT51504.1 unnamed protein product [Saprochaete ingens]
MTPSIDFIDLPLELHVCIAQYLSAYDRKRLSQTSQSLRPVYSRESWRHCTVDDSSISSSSTTPSIHFLLHESDPSIADPYLQTRKVPLRALRNPQKHSWFIPDAVISLRVRQPLPPDVDCSKFKALRQVSYGETVEVRVENRPEEFPENCTTQLHISDTNDQTISRLLLYEVSKSTGLHPDPRSSAVTVSKLQVSPTSALPPSFQPSAFAPVFASSLQELSISVSSLGLHAGAWLEYLAYHTHHLPYLKHLSIDGPKIHISTVQTTRYPVAVTREILALTHISSHVTECRVAPMILYDYDLDDSVATPVSAQITIPAVTELDFANNTCYNLLAKYLHFPRLDRVFFKPSPFLLAANLTSMADGLTHLQIGGKLATSAGTLSSIAQLPHLRVWQCHYFDAAVVRDRFSYSTFNAYASQVLAKPEITSLSSRSGIPSWRNAEVQSQFHTALAAITSNPLTAFQTIKKLAADDCLRALLLTLCGIEAVFRVACHLRELTHLCVIYPDSFSTSPGLQALLEQNSPSSYSKNSLQQVRVALVSKHPRVDPDFACLPQGYGMLPCFNRAANSAHVLYDLAQQRDLSRYQEIDPSNGCSVINSYQIKYDDMFEHDFVEWEH